MAKARHESAQHHSRINQERDIQDKLLELEDEDSNKPTDGGLQIPLSGRAWSSSRHPKSEDFCGWKAETTLQNQTVPSRVKQGPKEKDTSWRDSKARRIHVAFKHHHDLKRYMQQYRYQYTYSYGALGKEGIDVTSLESAFRDPSQSPGNSRTVHNLAPLKLKTRRPSLAYRPNPEPPDNNNTPKDNRLLSATQRPSRVLSEPNILQLTKYYKARSTDALKGVENGGKELALPEKTDPVEDSSWKSSIRKVSPKEGSNHQDKTSRGNSSNQVPVLAISHIRGEGLHVTAPCLPGKTLKQVPSNGCAMPVQPGSVCIYML